MSENTKTYTVQSFVKPEQLQKDLSINDTTLDDAMMEQASLFAHYGVLASKASKQVDAFEMLLETHEARVYKQLRTNAAVNSEKVTEAQLSKTVAQDSEVISIKKCVASAQQQESLAKSAVEAFRHRKDMLIQLGSMAREELKGELRLKGYASEEQRRAEVKEKVLANR